MAQPTPAPDLLSRLADAIEAEADKPRAEQVGLAHVMIAVVQPDLNARDAEIRRLRAELQQAQPELCADCGHLKSAHYDATGDDVSGCNASGAKVRSCNCWYFIPAAVSGA